MFLPMHSTDPILDRMLSHLAQDLGYDLSTGELNLYRQELTHYPIYKISDACTKAKSEYSKNHMPSLLWFKLELND
jgi:hypothetical protein